MFLFITGVSCVGKTTIGKLIAQKLGIEFHSVDYHVEQFYGKSIERIQQDCIGRAVRGIEKRPVRTDIG